MWRKVLGIGAVVLLVGTLIGGGAYIVLRDDAGSGNGLRAGRAGAGGGGAAGVLGNGGNGGRGGGAGVASGAGGNGAGGRWNRLDLPDAAGSEAMRGRGSGGGAGPSATGQAIAWQTITGTVVEAGADLVVQAADGTTVTVRVDPAHYREARGTPLLPGDTIRLLGFENEEGTVVGEIEDLSTGQVLARRDGAGQPLWAGQGRRGP